MENEKKIRSILKKLKSEYPDAKIGLKYSSIFELLVSTILSAQCTDKRVNIVTKELFTKYRNIDDFYNVSHKELAQDIYSTGFYNAKAKSIIGSAKMIVNDFKGEVPDNMNDLISLPGVGRKTANVILGHCFKAVGIVVDTHVIRLSNRLGLVDTNNAEKIEQELIKIVPKKQLTIFTHYIISHGRLVCSSRKPKCNDCILRKHCTFPK